MAGDFPRKQIEDSSQKPKRNVPRKQKGAYSWKGEGIILLESRTWLFLESNWWERSIRKQQDIYKEAEENTPKKQRRIL